MKSRCILPALGLASVLCVSATAAANEPPTLTAGGEVLEGEWLQPGEAVFRGIPYAAAPVGDLRWRPPAPHRARVGRQMAREFGATCPQTEFLHDWERAIAVAFGNGDKFAAPPSERARTASTSTSGRASLRRCRRQAAGDGLDPRRRVRGGGGISSSPISTTAPRSRARASSWSALNYRLGRARILRPSGPHRGGHEGPKVGQLHCARPDRGPALGAGEHPGVRRGSRPGDRVRGDPQAPPTC